MSKDLLGVREDFFEELKRGGFIKKDTVFGVDWREKSGVTYYYVCFNTTEEKTDAYNYIYGE